MEQIDLEQQVAAAKRSKKGKKTKSNLMKLDTKNTFGGDSSLFGGSSA